MREDGGMSVQDVAASVTTTVAVEAVAWGRAPKCTYPDGGQSHVNRRVVCADGFAVSAQASGSHYANDSHPGEDNAPYWRGMDVAPVYPFVTFEVGNPSADPGPSDVWDEYDSGGAWAWVPRQAVADLLDAHGGAVGWEAMKHESPAASHED